MSRLASQLTFNDLCTDLLIYIFSIAKLSTPTMITSIPLVCKTWHSIGNLKMAVDDPLVYGSFYFDPVVRQSPFTVAKYVLRDQNSNFALVDFLANRYNVLFFLSALNDTDYNPEFMDRLVALLAAKPDDQPDFGESGKLLIKTAAREIELRSVAFALMSLASRSQTSGVLLRVTDMLTELIDKLPCEHEKNQFILHLPNLPVTLPTKIPLLHNHIIELVHDAIVSSFFGLEEFSGTYAALNNTFHESLYFALFAKYFSFIENGDSIILQRVVSAGLRDMMPHYVAYVLGNVTCRMRLRKYCLTLRRHHFVSKRTLVMMFQALDSM
jgi:hypothetical protein